MKKPEGKENTSSDIAYSRKAIPSKSLDPLSHRETMDDNFTIFPPEKSGWIQQPGNMSGKPREDRTGQIIQLTRNWSKNFQQLQRHLKNIYTWTIKGEPSRTEWIPQDFYDFSRCWTDAPCKTLKIPIMDRCQPCWTHQETIGGKAASLTNPK